MASSGEAPSSQWFIMNSRKFTFFSGFFFTCLILVSPFLSSLFILMSLLSSSTLGSSRPLFGLVGLLETDRLGSRLRRFPGLSNFSVLELKPLGCSNGHSARVHARPYAHTTRWRLLDGFWPLAVLFTFVSESETEVSEPRPFAMETRAVPFKMLNCCHVV